MKDKTMRRMLKKIKEYFKKRDEPDDTCEHYHGFTYNIKSEHHETRKN